MSDSNFKYRFGTYGSRSNLKYNGADVYIGDKKVYLCPWELKHVDSITMSVSGTTATMGIPNKPASRTQIFDTSGCVRTFKISGRRYDWEEEISNWDFVNTQFNLAVDPDFGVPSTGNYYCYVGLNWLLSCMQVLLKGYVFSIINTNLDDDRFIYKNPDKPSQEVPDEGFNVALTQVSVTFSETEPGLMEYSLTLTERFKRGENFYRPYGANYSYESE